MCLYWASSADSGNYIQGGIAAAMIFGCAGAAYGTAKSGIGIAGVGTFRPDLIMKVSLHPFLKSRSPSAAG